MIMSEIQIEGLLADLTYSMVSHHVKVTVTPLYSTSESDPAKHHYVWHYHINIENMGEEQLHLVKRHWVLISANGQVQEVHGAGVVGVQPILNPGEGFEYHSEVALTTPSGLMIGKFEMVTPSGSMVEVDVPAFSLDSPLSKQYQN